MGRPGPRREPSSLADSASDSETKINIFLGLPQSGKRHIMQVIERIILNFETTFFKFYFKFQIYSNPYILSNLATIFNFLGNSESQYLIFMLFEGYRFHKTFFRRNLSRNVRHYADNGVNYADNGVNYAEKKFYETAQTTFCLSVFNYR